MDGQLYTDASKLQDYTLKRQIQKQQACFKHHRLRRAVAKTTI